MHQIVYKSHITASDTRRGLWKAIKHEIPIFLIFLLIALILLLIAIKADSARLKREADPTNDQYQSQHLPLIKARG